MGRQCILIIDFGGQYTQLIARKIRELGAYCEIHPYDINPAEIKTRSASGLILSGGPESVNDPSPNLPNPEIYELGLPILGICYGMQAMCKQLGGRVTRQHSREYGSAQLEYQLQTGLFPSDCNNSSNGIGTMQVWMSHGDAVVALPEGFATIARTDNGVVAAIANRPQNLYAVQFHPEVAHTSHGLEILQQFVFTICNHQANWQTGDIIGEIIDSIQASVKDQHVILALSGGVDSAVAAALLHKAIGKQLHCLLIDNGLLRHQEAVQVKTLLAEQLAIDLKVIDASESFLRVLTGVTDPEEKRRRIGHAFIETFQQHAKAFPKVKWLAQGTIYPDVIESAASSKSAKVIKTHHNVGGLPEKMSLQLIEPLRNLFKDEVRTVGRSLNLPESLLMRHPFPGPGLAVRIMGEVSIEYINILRQADQIFLDELHKHELYQTISQAFAVFIPIKTVGVVGDQRCYDYLIALRAVETSDFMTADWSSIPGRILAKIANRIINEVNHVSRVVYDISSKPPATIEWE